MFDLIMCEILICTKQSSRWIIWESVYVYGLAGRGRFFLWPRCCWQGWFFSFEICSKSPSQISQFEFSFYTHYPAFAFPDISVLLYCGIVEIIYLTNESLSNGGCCIVFCIVMKKVNRLDNLSSPQEVTCWFASCFLRRMQFLADCPGPVTNTEITIMWVAKFSIIL